MNMPKDAATLDPRVVESRAEALMADDYEAQEPYFLEEVKE